MEGFFGSLKSWKTHRNENGDGGGNTVLQLLMLMLAFHLILGQNVPGFKPQSLKKDFVVIGTQKSTTEFHSLPEQLGENERDV